MVQYINLLEHEVIIQTYKDQDIKDMLMFKKSDRSKPQVTYKTVDVENPYIDIMSGDKILVSVTNLPKVKEGVVYIVNAFILEALYSFDKENAKYFAAPGKQVRGSDGKVLYAKGLYAKSIC